MSRKSKATVAGSTWPQLRRRIEQGTVLIIGKPGLGKSWLAHVLAEQLAARGQRVGLLSTDMGQASVGVPTCLGLSVAAGWQEPVASWFIGDTTPVGNLLPTVVGTAQLAQYARRLQVQTLIIDTSGLVDPPVGHLLKYHKLLALGAVDHLIALQQSSELEPLLTLLQARCRLLHRLSPAAQARVRTPHERRQYRQARLRAHFQGGGALELDPSCVLNHDWTLGARARLASGTVVGLLNREGFCMSLGLVRELQPDRLLLFTPWRDRNTVAWVQVGKIQLSPEGEEISRS